MILSEPLDGETLGQYVSRLLNTKEITTSQINIAIRKFNNK